MVGNLEPQQHEYSLDVEVHVHNLLGAHCAESLMRMQDTAETIRRSLLVERRPATSKLELNPALVQGYALSLIWEPILASLEERRWEGDPAGLSRRDRRPSLYSAYLPDPLVGRRFVLDGDVAAEVADAEAALVRLDATASALTGAEAFARLLLRAESVASSRIEGLEVRRRARPGERGAAQPRFRGARPDRGLHCPGAATGKPRRGYARVRSRAPRNGRRRVE